MTEITTKTDLITTLKDSNQRVTNREMLFFTIYHNFRHASQEGD